MRPALEKALEALLTDPISGDRLDWAQMVLLAWTILTIFVVVVALVIGVLGLGAGQ